MTTTVKKRGDSARLGPDEVGEVQEEAGRIVIEPVKQKTYKLCRPVERNQLEESSWTGRVRPSPRHRGLAAPRREIPGPGERGADWPKRGLRSGRLIG
jgi:hypothetical protein